MLDGCMFGNKRLVLVCAPLTIVAPDEHITILVLQLTIDILLHTAQPPTAACCETDAAAINQCI
jgi:hypothetical protein